MEFNYQNEQSGKKFGFKIHSSVLIGLISLIKLLSWLLI
ncbi:hypothetical protein HMPREF9413_4809 [Paenibacillus sp. HGF7]|nr:hypothetical protein HMPREF9413_4809 [Paenibacillus sp. HGF7]EPD81335.1 hypothetical protein HMPREF1207_05093 [Paenibacillus sp. HGH0039]